MESAAPTNKTNKKSLFTCFRPAAGSVVKDRSFRATDPVLEYLAVADENGVVAYSAAEDSGEECGRRRRRKNSMDRWRAIRSAFNGTTMMKKIKNSRRKSNKDTNSSMSSSSSSTLEGGGEGSTKILNLQPNTSSRNTSNNSSTFSNSSSAFTPSTSSSLSFSCSSHSTEPVSATSSREICSPSLNNGSTAVKQKQCEFEDKRKGHCCVSNTVLCMFLVSLLVLILWGRSVAILCTSILFYLVRPSRRRPSSCNNEGVLHGDSNNNNNNEFDSVQYKKKVIMEGLLDRSHTRVPLATSTAPKLM